MSDLPPIPEEWVEHSAYVEPLDGGWAGYQARCWDCDWRGAEYLRDDGEQMGTEVSRAHKRGARSEAIQHRRENWTAVARFDGPIRVGVWYDSRGGFGVMRLGEHPGSNATDNASARAIPKGAGGV